MSLAPIIAVLLVTAVTALARETISRKVEGKWYLQRIVPLTDDDVYSCYTTFSKVLNDTAVDTRFSYKFNGKSRTINFNHNLEKIGKSGDDTYFVTEYTIDDDEDSSLGIKEWCLSRSINVHGEIDAECPTSKFINIDNSKCE